MIKRISAVVAACLLFAGAHAGEVVRLSEPVAATDTTETFGSPLDEAVPLVELADVGAGNVGETVRVEARVSQVCKKKGCFFIAVDGDTTVRVSFKDYGFFVPTDVSGKRVTFVGEIIEKELSKEEAEHFTQDMGEASAAVSSGKTYEIVATAVRVPRG
jgi:hypothetical protein